KSAVELFEAAADGAVRLLWIACTNPAQSMPDQAPVRRALERAEFVIVQEAFARTATRAHAHLWRAATAAPAACRRRCPQGVKRGTTGKSRATARSGWPRASRPNASRCSTTR